VKLSELCVSALLGIAACCVSAAEPEKEAPPLRLELHLSDGSCVIGVPTLTTIPLRTSYASMSIKLEQLSSIQIGEDHETASVEMRNGDKLKGVVTLGPTRLKTIFGEVSIGLEHIREARVLTGSGSLPESLKRGLVMYYSFDQEDGKVVHDLSGNKKDAEVHGAKWTANGRIGGG
jgi:hypothetical protein